MVYPYTYTTIVIGAARDRFSSPRHTSLALVLYVSREENVLKNSLSEYRENVSFFFWSDVRMSFENVTGPTIRFFFFLFFRSLVKPEIWSVRVGRRYRSTITRTGGGKSNNNTVRDDIRLAYGKLRWGRDLGTNSFRNVIKLYCTRRRIVKV